MRNRLVAKQKRNITVKSYLNAHPEIVNRIPGLASAFSNFNICIDDINRCIDQVMLDTSGPKTMKTSVRQTLVTTTADSARKLRAFALNSDNTVLMKEASITETNLNRCSEVELCEMSKSVRKRIEDNLASLNAYGITADTLTNFQKTIDEYETSIPVLRLGTTDKKQNNQTMEELYDKANSILKKMDMLVDTTKLTDPAFYNGYYSARKIIVTGVGSLMVKGIVTDSSTHQGLPGATITFSRTDTKGVSDIVKRSAAKGGFNIKSLPEGMYRVAVSKTGYITQEITVAITSGEFTHISIDLVKA